MSLFSSSPSLPSSPTASSTASSEFRSPLTLPNSHLIFYGVPFKWEEQPGIPKHSSHEVPKNDNDQLIKKMPRQPLPPPPSGTPDRPLMSSVDKKKKLVSGHAKLGRDPFMAALLICTQPDHECCRWKLSSSRVSRIIRDRFGSCKSISCAVESTVSIPRSSRPTYGTLSIDG